MNNLSSSVRRPVDRKTMHPMLSVAIPALVLSLSGLTCAQTSKARSLDFSSTATEKGRVTFEVELALLRQRLASHKTVDAEVLARLQSAAMKALKDDEPVRRMLAARTLGTLTHAPEPKPALHLALIATTRANKRLVRREAIVQLREAPFPALGLMLEAHKALVSVSRAHLEDPAMTALATHAAQILSGGVEARRAEELAQKSGQLAKKTKRGRVDLFGLAASSRDRNESAAFATLRNISSAQAQAQASGVIDTDQDGMGKYGYFGELSSGQTVRSDEAGGVGAWRIAPPVLSGAFANVRGTIVKRSGYCFRIFLPMKGAIGSPEADKGGSKGRKIKADLAEVLWCAYAWPIEMGKTGTRVFFVNQSGNVLSANNQATRYSGDCMPGAQAAFLTSEAATSKMSDDLALGRFGRDGNHWRVGHLAARPR